MNEQLLLTIGGFFLVMNLTAFLVMFWDKRRSRKRGVERISEGMMFFLAAIFGSVGIYSGMFVFRHKTRKWYFLVGIPAIMLQNCAALFVLYLMLEG